MVSMISLRLDGFVRASLFLMATTLGSYIEVAAADIPTGSLQPAPLSIDLVGEVLREKSFRESSMLTLGAWALGNLAIGGFAARSSRGDAREFWWMTAYWNVVNLGIAGFGYFGAEELPGMLRTWSDLFREREKLRGFLLLNTGLDVAYVLGGWAMLERGLRRSGSDGARWRGFGRAVAVQGAFLLAFDLALLSVQPRGGAPDRFAGWKLRPAAWAGAPGAGPVWGLSLRRD
jgi:hypothetical protein